MKKMVVYSLVGYMGYILLVSVVVIFFSILGIVF